jgi:hypothetical protein
MYSHLLFIMIITLFVSDDWRSLLVLFIKFIQERKAKKHNSKDNTFSHELKVCGMCSYGSQ